MNAEITQEQALKAIAELATASMEHYQAANGLARKSPNTCASRELKAAMKLAKLLGHVPTEHEIMEALGW